MMYGWMTNSTNNARVLLLLVVVVHVINFSTRGRIVAAGSCFNGSYHTLLSTTTEFSPVNAACPSKTVTPEF